jgi:hypothetical protein
MSKESSHPTPPSVCRPRHAGGRHRAPRRPSPLGRALALAVATGLAGVTPLVAGAAPASADVNWDAVAQCESGGNWQINTQNGFSGGLQFTRSTWRSAGGSRYASEAHRATRSEQIAVAQRVLATQGIGAWPVCGSKGKGYGHRSWSSEASRSYKRHSYPTRHRAAKHNGYGANRYTNKSAGSGSSWRHAESIETRSHRSHYRKRVITAPPKKIAAIPASLVVVSDFIPQRMFSMRPVVQRRRLPVTYLVHSGDSLVQIAVSHKISWQALYVRNRASIGLNPNVIAPGLRLVVG